MARWSQLTHWSLTGVVAAGIACDSTSPPLPEAGAVQAERIFVAQGQETAVVVTVQHVDGTAYAGARVRWVPRAADPPAPIANAVTDAGGVAFSMWQAPATRGEHEFDVVVNDQVKAQQRISVVDDDPVHFEVSATSMRITNSAPRGVRIRVWDHENNELDYRDALSITTEGTFDLTFGPESLYVWARGSMQGVGAIRISAPALPGHAPQTARVELTRVIVLKELRVTGVGAGLDLATGETHTIEYFGKDSSGTSWPVTPDAAGITFSSSNSSVASVSEAGAVTGASIGNATITVSHAAGDTTVGVAVEQGYDFGALTDLYAVPPRELYTQHFAPAFRPDGRSVMLIQSYPHASAGSPGGATVRWLNANGSTLRSHSMGYPGAIATLSDGTVFANQPLTRFNAEGGTVWTRAETGTRVVADDSLVVLVRDNSLLGFSVNGALLWTYTPGAGIGAVMLAPTRVYFTRAGQVHALSRAAIHQWSVAAAADTILTDAASRAFVRANNHVEAYGPDGAKLWETSAPASQLGVGAGDSFVVLEESVIRLLDRTTGQERWSATRPASTVAASVVGDRVIALARHLRVYDRATGAYLGRSTTILGTGASMAILPPTCVGSSLVLSTTRAYRYAKCQ